MEITIEILKRFIRPELFILIPVLYFLGKIMKDTSVVKDKLIPVVLGFVAIVLSVVYILATTELGMYRDALMAVFLALTQGVLCAGCAVYVHEIFAQLKKGE